MLRSRLIALFAFLSRWLEVTSATACCDVCPTFIRAAAEGLLLPIIFGNSEKNPD
jgi:hypothetical protein